MSCNSSLAPEETCRLFSKEYDFGLQIKAGRTALNPAKAIKEICVSPKNDLSFVGFDVISFA